ncbi:MAG: thioesterase family protein, partial [Gammaproteobacteria bacterium]|nr:thioesterase family protein [Gammaproteobacteria bacterium]
FNKFLGFRVVSLDPKMPVICLDMRDELVGNFVHGGLHGGVTSAILDVTGGLVAFLNVTEKLVELSDEEKLNRFGKLNTIDLRVDYLRPGRGVHFAARGFILRTGNKVAVTRMELHNDTNELIAVGTGAYTVS